MNTQNKNQIKIMHYSTHGYKIFIYKIMHAYIHTSKEYKFYSNWGELSLLDLKIIIKVGLNSETQL